MFSFCSFALKMVLSSDFFISIFKNQSIKNIYVSKKGSYFYSMLTVLQKLLAFRDCTTNQIQYTFVNYQKKKIRTIGVCCFTELNEKKRKENRVY